MITIEQKVKNRLIQLELDLQVLENEYLSHPNWIDKNLKYELDETKFLLTYEKEILLNLLKGTIL